MDLEHIHDTQVVLLARLNRLESKYDLLAEKLGIEDWDKYDDVLTNEEIKGAMHTINQSLTNYKGL